MHRVITYVCTDCTYAPTTSTCAPTDDSNDEIRGGGVRRDAGGDEKQLIKFAWPYLSEIL